MSSDSFLSGGGGGRGVLSPCLSGPIVLCRVMFTEIDPIERELRARLRVLESITYRIRAAECGVCAVVRWRADDLGAGNVEIVRMEPAG